MNKLPISVAVATFNEESNIDRCLKSVSSWVDEIVVVDGQSTDNTVNIVKKYSNTKLISRKNNPNFHINKQIAIDHCQNDWVLLLDADEEVSPALAHEISKVSTMSEQEKSQHYLQTISKHPLFDRHQQLLNLRDHHVQNHQGFVAYFIPRKNYFLGRYLNYGGVYPDGVIRFFNRHFAHQPAQDVHEQISADGQIGWLSSDLLHYADPTFSRYLMRNDRYTTLIAQDLSKQGLKINFVNFVIYVLVKPLFWFLSTFIRHKGFKDGFPGFVFSWYSSLRFSIAFIKLYELQNRH